MTARGRTRYTLAMSGTPRLTLAHLSDIHLAPLPPAHVLDLCSKRITGYLNWQHKRRYVHDRKVLERIVADLKAQNADHIAVTGDIANIGLEAEYAAGRAFLDTLGTPETVSLVPGNHDIYLAECVDFAARQWGPFMRGDSGETFPYLRVRGPLAIIGASSGVPTPPFQATGELGAAQREALARLLASTREQGLFRAVLIHHPPVSESPHHKRLTDADAFMDVIAQHGAELVLHGHDHRDMLNWLPGPAGTRVAAVGVASASSVPDKDNGDAGYHLYRIGGEPGAWQCEMVTRVMGEDLVVREARRMAL